MTKLARITDVISRSPSTRNIGTTTKLSQNVAARVTKMAVSGGGSRRRFWSAPTASTNTTRSRSSAVSTITTAPPPTMPVASPTPGLAGERITKEGVDPDSRSRGRSLVVGRSAVLGEEDNRLLAGGDKEVVFRLSDPMSESNGRGARARPTQGPP